MPAGRPRRTLAARAALVGLAAGWAVGGCGPSRAVIASCDDDLGGVWIGERGERWMILDHGGALEAYPLFDDGTPRGEVAAPPDLVPAPRAIDLARERGRLAGLVKRRYLRGAAACTATAPARITACAGDTLELVLAEPTPPPAFAPCTPGRPAPSHRERWRRE